MKKTDHVKVVCMRVGAPGTIIAGSTQATCGTCKGSVWLSPSSRSLGVNCTLTIRCGDCFGKEPFEGDEKLVLTGEQLREVGAELLRRRRKAAEKN